MSEKRLKAIEKRIAKIKAALTEIGPLRPGSLTRQYKDPKAKRGPFWQLSYTRAMKSRTEYVRPENLPEIRRQLAAYQRFKTLIEEWIDLGIEASKLKMQLEKNEPSK